MKSISLVILTLCLLLLGACSSIKNLSGLDWVLGKWQINDSDSFEEWVAVSDDLYRGKSYQVVGAKAVVTETIEITRVGNQVFYTPTVIDQNEGKAVSFTLISRPTNELVFENKMHDFPQRIIYAKNGDNQIDARIEGMRNGQLSEVGFQLKKVD